MLSNTATAELELAAMSGALSEQAVTPQERQDAAIQAEIEQLIASQPFGSVGSYDSDNNFIPGKAPNLTNQLRLKALAPEKAMVLEEAAKPKIGDPGAINQEEADRINAQLASMRAARLG